MKRRIFCYVCISDDLTVEVNSSGAVLINFTNNAFQVFVGKLVIQLM